MVSLANHTAAKFGKKRADKQAVAVALHSARKNLNLTKKKGK